MAVLIPLAGYIIGGYAAAGAAFSATGAMLGMAIGSVLGSLLFPAKVPKMSLLTSSTIQNASVGGAVPVAYGTNRMAGNIIWVGGLHPYEPDTGGKKGGGKGGGKSSSGISFYRRSFLIGICEGPIIGISKAWKGKDEISIGAFTTFLGDGNAGLKTLVGEDYTDYKHLACVFFSEYDLGSSEAIPNFNFEINAEKDLYANKVAPWIPINTAAGLQAMNNDLNGWYYLTRDIDLSGVAWTPIGDMHTGPFRGSFDGCGHSIFNLTLVRPVASQEDGGLFGAIQNAGYAGNITHVVTIGNVQLKNFHITALGDNSAAGCLVGRMTGGIIQKCSVEGSVNASWASGGLIGFAWDVGYGSSFPCTFQNCCSKASVNGSQYKGGLVGHVIGYGSIISCYATGAVAGPGAGTTGGHGILGYGYGGPYTIKAYWDTQTSGCSVGMNSYYNPQYFYPESYWTGKTTVQMKQKATYLPTTDWNFDTIWFVDEGITYPDFYFTISANPVFCIYDLLTNAVYGAGIPIERIDAVSFAAVQAYCDANSFHIRIVLDSQKPLTDWIDYILSHFCGYLVMDAETIKIGVLQDESSTFTITADDLVVEGDSPPVDIKKKDYKDSFNRIEVLWIDVANNYLHAITTANDEVDQSISGKIRVNKIELAGIGNAAYAGKIAWKYLAESMYRSSVYSFTLGYGKMVLQPGDVGTLSDGYTIVAKKIRIVSISEAKDGKNLAIEAIEEVPSVYSDYDYSQQSSEYVKPPVPTLTSPAAYFVEKIGESNELNISLKPQDAFATGYVIYKSLDDSTYQYIGYLPYISTAGTLVTGLPSESSLIWKPIQSFDIEVGLQGVLSPVSEADFFQGNSICVVGEEFIGFETATLIAGGTKRYRISNLIRGMFNSDPVAHSAAEQFIFLKNPFSYKLKMEDIGTTIYFKFLTSYGKYTQLLEEVASVPYTISGNKYAAGPANLIAIKDREGMLDYSGADVTVQWNLTSRLAGYNSLGYGILGYSSSLSDPLQHIILQVLDGETVLEEQVLAPDAVEKLITPTQDVVAVKVIPATMLQSPVKRSIIITKIT